MQCDRLMLMVGLSFLTLSRWLTDRKSGSAGMPRPISYAVFCLKKKNVWFLQNPITGLIDIASHIDLPATTIPIVTIAGDSRFMRSSLLDAIHQDYVRTARAKGLSERVVVLKHALRNALLPVVTNIAI